MDILNYVTPSSELIPLLQTRYSTREYQPGRDVDAATLTRLFEAARWSPSCNNEQPWRFVVAAKSRNPEGWDRIASTIVPGNAWALHAPVLGISIASLRFARNGKPNRWAAHDVGQAMAHLTVQAEQEGVNVHQMGGFDPAKAVEVLAIPDGFEAVAAFAIGYAAHPAPAERARREASTFLFDGIFGEPHR